MAVSSDFLLSCAVMEEYKIKSYGPGSILPPRFCSNYEPQSRAPNFASFPNDMDENGSSQPELVNQTSISDSDDLDRPYVRPAIFGVLALGCLTNVVLLVVFIRHKSMHTVVNIYLGNLAISDVLLLVLGSFGVLTDVLEYLPRNYLGCLYIVLTSVPYCASFFTVSLLTLERYYAVCQPFKYRTMSSTRRSFGRVAFVWCCSLLFSALTNLESGLSGQGCRALEDAQNSLMGENCEAPRQRLIYSDIFRPLLTITLLFINSVLYFKIIRSLKKSMLFRNTFASSVPVWFKNVRRSRTRMTGMLAVNTLVFFVCNTPRMALLVIDFVRAVLELPPITNGTLMIISTALLLLNSCVNPFIYVLTHRQYRRAFREAMLPPCRTSASRESRKRVYTLQTSNKNSQTESFPSPTPDQTSETTAGAQPVVDLA